MKTRVRARGALYGLAIGDALGMPTQMLSRPQIVARWGTAGRFAAPRPPDRRGPARGHGHRRHRAGQACLLAASLGGDCDTIAAMVGAMAGACHGLGAFPADALAVIDAQDFGLTALADDLCALRSRAGRGALSRGRTTVHIFANCCQNLAP